MMKRELYYRDFNGTIEDVNMVKDCFINNGLHKELDKLKWLYVGGPNGIIKSSFALEIDKDGNEILAGIYVLFPIEFKIGNKKKLCLQSLDTLTDENYRGRGLFKKLASDVYKKCGEEEFEFVYGFPNKNSSYGFFNKLGWGNIGDVPFLIMPVNTRYFFSKIPFIKKISNLLPNIKLVRCEKTSELLIRDIHHFDHQVDKLWGEFSEEIAIAINRNSEYLNWRYINKPNENYKLKGYFEEGRLLGFIVYTNKEKHGGKVGYIMELIYSRNREDVGDELLKFAKKEMILGGVDVCLSWSFEHSPNYTVFKKNKFYNFPKFMRPIELNFGCKTFKNNLSYSNQKSWYISYSDSDTV